MKQLWSDWMKSLVVIVSLGVLAGSASVAWGHGGGEDESHSGSGSRSSFNSMWPLSAAVKT